MSVPFYVDGLAREPWSNHCWNWQASPRTQERGSKMEPRTKIKSPKHRMPVEGLISSESQWSSCVLLFLWIVVIADNTGVPETRSFGKASVALPPWEMSNTVDQAVPCGCVIDLFMHIAPQHQLRLFPSSLLCVDPSLHSPFLHVRYLVSWLFRVPSLHWHVPAYPVVWHKWIWVSAVPQWKIFFRAISLECHMSTQGSARSCLEHQGAGDSVGPQGDGAVPDVRAEAWGQEKGTAGSGSCVATLWVWPATSHVPALTLSLVACRDKSLNQIVPTRLQVSKVLSI